jgi:SH3-like domain-containing protein
MTSIKLRKVFLSGLALVAAGTGAAVAAPGDIHRVAGADVVNLRAGPSDETNIRGRVEQGDEVIELTREGSWVGVRVLQTGEEGWIFSGLLDTISQSGLSPAVGGGDAGFLQLSESFDVLMRRINTQLGYPVVDAVEQAGDGFLRVTPSPQWLLNGSREAHMMAAAAIYQMWKNHQNSAPVGVVMADAAGEDYITIRDEASGPSLSIAR